MEPDPLCTNATSRPGPLRRWKGRPHRGGRPWAWASSRSSAGFVVPRVLQDSAGLGVEVDIPLDVLRRALHPHGFGASDFEVLDVLAEGAAEDGPASWRVQELAGRVHLSKSALSRTVARLEKDGLVLRGMCAEDRRGVQVKLTEKGLAPHAEVLPLQREVLTRMLDRSS
ncbi:MarR family transcriptional regulator [Streptomyces sp. NBC_01077]|uniref:MarR family winged helix-turn-helix transcriptional regulator n=1 Tax=Streptomyces sp. NBC_01077 TaxID=2903746 RepID=UPI00386FDE12|nr:MarR family transcriptional regulator [Streptomyces sp. NBC_01077]WSV43447.1 MarR family transcriptional regulator [Streptomyces sp. NBC_01077]